MHAMVLDIEDPGTLAAFAERGVAEYRALNIMINNAGGPHQNPQSGRRGGNDKPTRDQRR
jgi:short-subunit dehydrogenase involved in D-alanine esterification of teichoic acids